MKFVLYLVGAAVLAIPAPFSGVPTLSGPVRHHPLFWSVALT